MINPSLPERVLFIIPAFNEAANIDGIIQRLKQEFPQVPVLVVDDGSADKTTSIARAAGARVLRLPFNLGIGIAVQSGFLYALENGFDWVIRLDADGQHDPANVPRFLDAMQAKPADLIIGSRFLTSEGYHSSLIRRLGITFFNRVISMLTGFHITDPTSGFTAFSRNAMVRLARFFPDDYPEPECIIMLYKWGMTVTEIPVAMHRRSCGVSSITMLRSLYYMIKVTLAVLLDIVRY